MDETEQMEAERSANFFAKRRLEERGLFRSAIPFRAYERRRAKRSPGRSAPPPSPWMRLSKWRPSDLRIFSRSADWKNVGSSDLLSPSEHMNAGVLSGRPVGALRRHHHG